MHFFLQKIPFFIELVFNAPFILLYYLNKHQKLVFWPGQEYIDTFLELSSKGVPLVVFFVVVLNYLNVSYFEEFFRKHIFSLIIFTPLIITWGDSEFTFWLSSVHFLSSILNFYEKEDHQEITLPTLQVVKFRPAQVVLVTFLGLIMVGTSILMLPISSLDGRSIPFIDALFMATSATCVTGLATLSLKNDFSLFGQLVVLILMQIGGLGIMTLSYGMTILLGRSMAMKERIIMQDLLDVSSLEQLISLIIDIIKYTIFIEFWGAVFLTIGLSYEGIEFSKALYYGIFHSVSAFCNAGFTLFDNSLESFATSPFIHGVIAVLIIFGGLGFITMKELRTSFLKHRTFNRLSLHTKVVLIVSLALTALGFFVVFFGEFLHGLDGLSLWEKIQVSFFQSVTLRTAGFNTLPLTSLQTHTLYLMTMFMFVGAGSGSTGGGIKTSTLAILLQSIRATLKGKGQVQIFDRTIPNLLVVRSTALVIISIILTTLFIFVLMRIESEQTFLSIFFEVISASATVGLSLGITPTLSVAGKLGISLLMLIGRVGPLTLVLAIGQQRKSVGEFGYPEGKIMIG